MATISISKQLFKFFCVNAVPDQVDQAYAAALNVYGASVANALEMWRDNLKVAGKMLTAHPDGVTRFDVCAITGILQECEIGRVEDAPDLPPKVDYFELYGGFLVGFREHYASVEDAHNSGAIYQIGDTLPLTAYDSTVLAQYKTAEDAINLVTEPRAAVLGYVLKEGNFASLAHVQELAEEHKTTLRRVIQGVY